MAFFRRPAQLTAMHWSTADRVEVWFRVSKVDQILKRAVLSRVQADLPRPGGAGGGVVDLLIELMSCYLFLPSSPPLAAYGVGDGKWSMRSQQQATTAMREVVTLAGMRTEGYSLYSLGIGGATHVSAEEATPAVLQGEGRWASNAYKTYVHSHGKDASWVANVMAKGGGVTGSSRGRVQKYTR